MVHALHQPRRSILPRPRGVAVNNQRAEPLCSSARVAAGVSPALEPGILPGGTSLCILQIVLLVCSSPNNRAFFPGGKMPPSTAARMATATLKHKPFCLFLRRLVAAHEADALGHFRDGMFPVVLVLDGDIAFKVLAFQLVENSGNVRNTGAVRLVVRFKFSEFVQVLEVAADDPA